MTVNDIERLENAARSVFGHEDTDGSDRSETTQSRARRSLPACSTTCRSAAPRPRLLFRKPLPDSVR